MATVRSGTVPVVLIVDVQNAVFAQAHRRAEVLDNIGQIIRSARAAGLPILWVQHADDQMPAHSHGWELVPGLDVRDDDHHVGKQFNSAFEETGLESILQHLQATKIILAGASTNWCIRATAYGALDRGYDVCLIGDAHTTESLAAEGGRTIAAQDIIDELNIAMTWLSYPGRTSQTISTLDFTKHQGR